MLDPLSPLYMNATKQEMDTTQTQEHESKGTFKQAALIFLKELCNTDTIKRANTYATLRKLPHVLCKVSDTNMKHCSQPTFCSPLIFILERVNVPCVTMVITTNPGV